MSGKLFVNFSPVQSLASFAQNKVLYREYKPSADLRQLIHCYWISPALPCGNTWVNGFYPLIEEIIIPDGCSDIIFEIVREDNRYTSKIVGMMDKPIITTPDFLRFQTFGIRFLPTGLTSILRIPASEFTNSLTEFAGVSAQMQKEIAEILYAYGSMEERLCGLNAYFRSKMQNNTQANFVKNTLMDIFTEKGNVSVRDLAWRQGVSERHLNRTFGYWVGLSPKSFTRVVRFQHIAREMSLRDRTDWFSLVDEGGYYDQSHFINDFKSLCGKTPSEFIR